MPPSPDPETVQWVYDYISHYRFNPEIITRFLQNKWRDYDEFFVEEVGKQFRFWVPRKLTAVRSSLTIIAYRAKLRDVASLTVYQSEQEDLLAERLPET